MCIRDRGCPLHNGQWPEDPRPTRRCAPTCSADRAQAEGSGGAGRSGVNLTIPTTHPMSLTISLPSVLSRLTDGSRSLSASGNTVGEAVADVTRRFPSLAPRLVDDLRFSGGFTASVRDGDELTIVSAVAGG